MGILEYDDEATQRLLAVYTTPDIVAQRRDFLSAFDLKPGDRVLDVGAGPGFLAAEIAEAVGNSGSVCGVDISEPLLKIARSQTKGKNKIKYLHGDATQLPFQEEEFDVVVSTQVLEYVPDVEAALAEFHRIIKNGGRVVLLDTDWDSIVWHSPDRQRMNRILTAWEEHASDPFLPRTLASKLNRAGFHVESQKIMPLFNSGYDPNTYSNRMIDLVTSFVIGRNGITEDEAYEWARELRSSGETGQYFFSLNRYFFLAIKS
jgi:ubiquinone/menaquinone biosynthesis C-methylase UbiE